MAPRLTPAERQLRAITEDDWLAQVQDAAATFRWRFVHFRPAMTRHGWRTPVQGDGVGFPDTLMVRDRIVVAELKRHGPGHEPDDDQRQWLDDFERAGAVAKLWTPGDIDDVIETLR